MTTFFVHGNPKAQPRARATIRGNKPGVYDPGTSDGWKMMVAIAARETKQRFDGPVVVDLEFVFERPKRHWGVKGLLPGAPSYHTAKPDLDNLAKSTLDSMVSCGFLADDRIVVKLTLAKRWGVMDGCHVAVDHVDSAS